MEHLVIRLREDPSAAEWAVLDSDGRIVRPKADGALEEAAALAGGRRVVVLVPAVEVITTQASLPKASAARLRKILPYSLEDSLAEDVEDLVFGVGPRLESGAVAVAVVARARLEEWLARLADAGIEPAAVYSEAEGVPDTPSTLTLIVEDDRVYGRPPGGHAFAFDGLPLGQVLDVAEGVRELNHAVVYVDEPGRARHGESLRELGEWFESANVKLIGDAPLHRLAATLTTRPGTNLLQGEYAPKSNMGELWRPWRAAASLLGGLVLVTVLAQAAELVTLSRQDGALTEVLTEACRRDFSTPNLDACAGAVRARLGESGLVDDTGTGFLAALEVVAESRGAESRVEALSWRDRVMDLQLVVPDVPALEAFRQAVAESRRFEARIQSANPGEDGVEGRVQVTGAGR